MNREIVITREMRQDMELLNAFGQLGLVEAYLMNTVIVTDKVGMIVWRTFVDSMQELDWVDWLSDPRYED